MDRKDWMKEAFGPSVRKTPSMMPFVIIALLIAGAGLQGLLDRHKKIDAPSASPKSRATTSPHRPNTLVRETHTVEKIVEKTIIIRPKIVIVQNRNDSPAPAQRVLVDYRTSESYPRQKIHPTAQAPSRAWNREQALAEAKRRANEEIQRKLALEESRKAAMDRQKGPDQVKKEHIARKQTEMNTRRSTGYRTTYLQ